MTHITSRASTREKAPEAFKDALWPGAALLLLIKGPGGLRSCPGCSWVRACVFSGARGIGAGTAVAFIGLLNLVLRLRRLRSSFVVLECFWGISCCFRILERNESNER